MNKLPQYKSKNYGRNSKNSAGKNKQYLENLEKLKQGKLKKCCKKK